VVAALLAVACGDKDEPLGPVGSVPQGTTTTNPYAVPEVIDEAYVNRVLAGLDQVVGDAVRLVVKSRQMDEEVFYLLKSVSVGDTFQLKLDGLQADLMRGLPTYNEQPGNKKTTVTRLITTMETCIFAEVQKDFSAVNISGQPSLSTQWVVLVPLDTTRDEYNHNPTPWMFLYDGFLQDQSQPPDLCVAAS